MYGDRYKDFEPLTEIEQQDILRAEIGYALADDKLGLGRFREKYAAKMAETPDAHDFEVVSAAARYQRRCLRRPSRTPPPRSTRSTLSSAT